MTSTPENHNPASGNDEGPFARAHKKYRERGWRGTVPLPAREKHPPPTGWTGKAAVHPSDEQCEAWTKEIGYKLANIGQRLAECPPGPDGKIIYQIIGIDVDDYDAKTGAEEYDALEAKLGPLYKTYYSTARAFPSAIRFYRVPVGYSFRGKLSNSIEVIQKGHRYAVVWPSWNPKSNSQYQWYDPDGNPCEIPYVDDLPIISPDDPATALWFEYLTNGHTLWSEDDMDTESTVSEIEQWALSVFPGAKSDDDDVCHTMIRAVEAVVKSMWSEESSHDKITAAHWQLACLASEGHYSYAVAVAEVERVYIGSVLKRRKRNLREVRGEVMRSRVNALRKIKASMDNGVRPLVHGCSCAEDAAALDRFNAKFGKPGQQNGSEK
ncbi:MAG: bifunctional DNA primase/polymerase [Segniliparus sp.]|uniref:bifunctional DNA primase/polymerase n=1 Tax=Segniliparus sp. TaxID=2804064 RepID=UPI003F3742E5